MKGKAAGYIAGTFLFWVAVVCFMFAWQKLDQVMHVQAQEVVSSFNEQLRLNPEMFDRAMKGDRGPLLENQPQDLQGGALVAGQHTNVTMFRSAPADGK